MKRRIVGRKDIGWEKGNLQVYTFLTTYDNYIPKIRERRWKRKIIITVFRNPGLGKGDGNFDHTMRTATNTYNATYYTGNVDKNSKSYTGVYNKMLTKNSQPMLKSAVASVRTCFAGYLYDYHILLASQGRIASKQPCRFYPILCNS